MNNGATMPLIESEKRRPDFTPGVEITPDLPADLASDVLELLVATGRTVPASKWVPWVRQKMTRKNLEGLI